MRKERWLFSSQLLCLWIWGRKCLWTQYSRGCWAAKLCIRNSVLSPSGNKDTFSKSGKDDVLAHLHLHIFFFLARMRGLYAQTQTWPPEWQNKGLGLSRLGWLREGHSLSLSLDVCPRGRPSDTSIVCVLVCLGSNNKISQMDCS